MNEILFSRSFIERANYMEMQNRYSVHTLQETTTRLFKALCNPTIAVRNPFL